jgi:hypothetical protein
MDIQSPSKTQNPTVRQLASLKIVSRLLGHELHAQATSKTIQLSREEVVEVQTTLDLFIEEIARRHGGPATQPAATEPTMVPARN